MNQDEFYEEPQVLVVDDVAATRELLKGMLTDMGFKSIVEASDGREALEFLKKTRVQLIICDFVMNDMSGLDLRYQLLNLPYLVDVPFIMCSAVDEVPVIENALDLGAADYIVKPVDFDTLKSKVTEVLRKRMV